MSLIPMKNRRHRDLIKPEKTQSWTFLSEKSGDLRRDPGMIITVPGGFLRSNHVPSGPDQECLCILHKGNTSCQIAHPDFITSLPGNIDTIRRVKRIIYGETIRDGFALPTEMTGSIDMCPGVS
jgi:hypothetical protein